MRQFPIWMQRLFSTGRSSFWLNFLFLSVHIYVVAKSIHTSLMKMQQVFFIFFKNPWIAPVEVAIIGDHDVCNVLIRVFKRQSVYHIDLEFSWMFLVAWYTFYIVLNNTHHLAFCTAAAMMLTISLLNDATKMMLKATK